VHEREPDAAALVGAAARVLHAMEALEQARHLAAGMPVPLSRTSSSTIRRPGAATRDPTLERELEGVREQVEDDLLPHLAVDEHGGRRRQSTDERRARRARRPTGSCWRGRR
jgi:hypothetical protein